MKLFKLPGKSYNQKLSPLTLPELEMRDQLRKIVKVLAEDIGERNFVFYQNYLRAADFIEAQLIESGLKAQRQSYETSGLTFHNIEAEITGQKDRNKILVIGAHYDSTLHSPGANDNATGVAALLSLAKTFAEKESSLTIRFVAFANEEAPFFRTSQMGSLAYATRCKKRNENIVGMFSLETIGYFSGESGSQRYPFPIGFLYPATGDFIAFVSNFSSGKFLRKAGGLFRMHAKFPSEGGAFPSFIPGIAWSDQWAFWQQGYPAIMITDTAPFRYPYYHTAQDTVDKIQYEHLTRVVVGLQKMIQELA